MTDQSKGNILHALGPLWIGAALVSLIVGAFFNTLWEAIMPDRIVLYLLTVWLFLAPGVVILLVADRKR